MKLSDNTILITGGTAGIGLELGKTLLQLNNKVILLGRNQKKLQDLKKEGFETIECDMSDRTAIENASIHIQNKYPDLNMLFNNAGVQYNYDFLENVIPIEKNRPGSSHQYYRTNLDDAVIDPDSFSKQRCFYHQCHIRAWCFPKI